MLGFGGSVTDFALASYSNGIFESVVCFALVENDLRAALHFRIKEPLDYEPRTNNTPYLAKGESQLILTWK